MRPPLYLERLLPKSWDEHLPSEQVLFKSFIAYAAGDAFGAFYEFSGIPEDVPNRLLSKAGWPNGGISDDTMLTMLTLIACDSNDPYQAAETFRKLLNDRSHTLRGLGPTTRMALDMPVKDSERMSVGNSNGGMMRTGLLAMSLPDRSQRLSWLTSLVKATHKGERAIESAIALSDLIHLPVINRPKSEDSTKDFASGVSNDSTETLRALNRILAESNSLIEIITTSCRLGGDTDTTAALSAAIYCFWNPKSDEVFQLEWLSEVDWSELKDAPAALAALYALSERR